LDVYSYTFIKFGKYVRCQWLTPVILATQEAEIRRIMIQSQPRQIVRETLSRKNSSHKKKKKRAGGVAQGLALSSNPSTKKKKGGGVAKFKNPRQ
jgi:hypothetical protein